MSAQENGVNQKKNEGLIEGSAAQKATDPSIPVGVASSTEADGVSGNGEAGAMTLAQVRAKLNGTKGKRFWRSLDELAGTEEFQKAVEQEFPTAAQEWVDPVSRRGFMKLMGASMARAGVAGCTKQPAEPIFPYIRQPEDLVLGKPMYFATASPWPAGAVPTLV